MDRILEIATKVATPLALAGLIIGVLFLLFRQVLAKKIFPKLLRNQSAAVIHKIIDRMFVLALVAILLAVVAYIAGLFAKASQKPGNSSGRDSEPAPTSATLGPYRLTYQLISGVAIDRFLDQNIEPDWSRALTGEIYVVPNAVLEELRRLRASYSAPYGEDAEEVIVRTRGAAERRFNERETKSGLAGVIGNVFVGSTADVNELSFAVPNQNTASLLRDVIVDPRWKTAADGSFLMHSPVPKVYDFAAWKSLDRAELASFASDVDSRASERERTKFRFLLDVTQGGMPPGFAILELFAPECGEGDPFAQTLHVPELALRVAIIEAIGESPLHLGTFVIREGGAQTLRTPTETATLLARSRTRETVLFPVEGLKTSEKLIVPLELFFGDYREPAAGPGDAYWKRRSTELRKLCGERMPSSFTIDLNAGDSPSHQVPFTNADVCSFFARYTGPPPYDRQRFSYGPVVELVNLAVDGKQHALRAFDPALLVISGGAPIGSCPRLYVFDGTAWHREGEILVGARSRALERTDERRLRHPPKRIEIREEEHEVSRIDMVAARSSCGTAPPIMMPAADSRLRHRDGRYRTLHKGDRLAVSFDVPLVQPDCEIDVITVGYYEPSH